MQKYVPMSNFLTMFLTQQRQKMHSVQCALKVEAQYYNNNNSKCFNVLFLFCSPCSCTSKNIDFSLYFLKEKKCDFFQNCIFFKYQSIMWWNENATHNLLLNKIFNFELKKCCYFNSRYEYYIKYVGLDYFFISKKILFIRKICKYMFLYYYSFQAKHLESCIVFY